MSVETKMSEQGSDWETKMSSGSKHIADSISEHPLSVEYVDRRIKYGAENVRAIRIRLGAKIVRETRIRSRAENVRPTGIRSGAKNVRATRIRSRAVFWSQYT